MQFHRDAREALHWAALVAESFFMRDDLLDALSCIEWADSQLDIFNERVEAWKKSRPYDVVAKADPDTGHEHWQVPLCEPLPRVIPAEAGFIINALRSSLDLLANALAERNGHIGKKDVYFPVCETRAAFNNGGNRSGRKKIERLSVVALYRPDLRRR